ncbi:MAG: thiolase family protein [Bacteroidetes bacterium]|nr:thiolase family protein [Bacteroidota bacterium]MCW5895028.1 thiolase family protein [Bacteroidota bacterium]
MQRSRNAVIVSALRTPIGKYGGVLRDARPDDLGALVIKSLVGKAGIDPTLIDDVLWGCANQAGEDNRNVGRMSALLAGLPHSVPANTINRLCGSSLDAIIQAARAIWSNDADIILAGGVESMSRAPYSVAKNQSGSFGNITAFDTALGWRYPNPKMEKMFPLESMGETAENVAEKYKILREEQDEFALRSHQKSIEAQKAGRFRDELIPVELPSKKAEPVVVSQDEGPRADTTLEKLAKLPAVFRKGGSVTPGNSSSLNDGAAGVIVTSEEKAKQLGFKPMARILSTGIAGVDPRYMGIGPVPATQMALKKAGLTIADMDVIELNEAFAAQSIAVIRDLQIPMEKLNPNGGAIALGHPLGCSGARIMTTLLHEMQRRNARYGLATMCIGVGQGVAAVVEKI